jgi:hypothetical protein
MSLKTEILEALEELREKHLDDQHTNSEQGSEEGELACAKEARKIASLIRKVKAL